MKKTKKVLLTNKSVTIFIGIAVIAIALGLMVGSPFLMDFETAELWAIIVAFLLFGFLLIFGILILFSGIYIYPNGNVLCNFGWKIRLFSLKDINNIKIIFYEQPNGQYLANVSVLLANGKKFEQNNVQMVNEYPSHRNSSSAMTLIKKEQVESVREQLANEGKFAVEIKKIYE